MSVTRRLQHLTFARTHQVHPGTAPCHLSFGAAAGSSLGSAMSTAFSASPKSADQNGSSGLAAMPSEFGSATVHCAGRSSESRKPSHPIERQNRAAVGSLTFAALAVCAVLTRTAASMPFRTALAAQRSAGRSEGRIRRVTPIRFIAVVRPRSAESAELCAESCAGLVCKFPRDSSIFVPGRRPSEFRTLEA